MSRLQRATAQLERVRRPVAATIAKYPGEILVSIAAIAAWTLFTAGIACVVPAHFVRAAWFASSGLFLFSLSGWKFLLRIATDGLYVLTRKPHA